MLTPLRRALNAATRYRLVRAPTMGAIGALTALSARVLRGVDAVAEVYARGSYGRGDFRPFLSDIDFAIAVRHPAGRGYQTCRALGRRLTLARALNPFVRDPWQTIVTEGQWPLVARYGRLMGIEDWRLLSGTPPWPEAAPVDRVLALAAWWNRQHFWTMTAVRQALLGQTALRQLEASVKKARAFGRRLADPAPGALSPHGALWELDRTAARVIRELGLDAPTGRRAAERVEVARPTERERRALLAIATTLDLERDGMTVLGSEGVLHLAGGREWTAEEYRTRLDALTRVRQSTGVLAFLYSPHTFALAPLTRRLRLLRPGDVLAGPASAAEPLLLREQLLYQSLYLGTNVWVAAGRAEPGPGLARHVANAIEACGYFSGGVLLPEPLGVRETLARVEPLDPELGRCLDRVAGLRERLAGTPGPEPLFEAGAIAAGRAAELLCDDAARPGHPAVAASWG